jgi:recombination protein RecA
VVKNKMAPPFRQADFDIMFNEGISRLGEVIDLGVEKGIIEKSGAWYAYKGDRIGQGRENAKQFLREQSTIANEAESRIREAYGLLPREKSAHKGADA